MEDELLNLEGVTSEHKELVAVVALLAEAAAMTLSTTVLQRGEERYVCCRMWLLEAVYGENGTHCINNHYSLLIKLLAAISNIRVKDLFIYLFETTLAFVP